jgi:hypothetical protein
MPVAFETFYLTGQLGIKDNKLLKNYKFKL